jgi:hypothetical protein
MTPHEFDALPSSPRCGLRAPELHEFHATIADVTDEHHQNMPGLVQPEDFNADVVVRFLRHNGIEAAADGTTAFRYKLADPARERHARFACVCLRASISYAIEAAYWCIEAKR